MGISKDYGKLYLESSPAENRIHLRCAREYWSDIKPWRMRRFKLEVTAVLPTRRKSFP